MKKPFTLQIQRLFMALFFSVFCFGVSGQDYKPYPVFYPLADIPEFNYGSTTAVNYAKSTVVTWKDDSGKWSNCLSAAFVRVPSTTMPSAPYGKGFSLAIGSSRATFVNIRTPYVLPGTYRVFLGTNLNSGTNRAQTMTVVKMDSVLLTLADTTKRSFAAGYNGRPNKQSVKFTGTGRRDYDINCGTVTILTPGTHNFNFKISGGGTNYAFTNLSLIPVTAKDTITDYEYPMFDNSGHVFLNSADTTPVNNTAAPIGYYLPYQAVDSTVYTKYNVTLDAGLYFANKNVVVKRAEDVWTRMYEGVAGADGLCSAVLPAGNFVVEINNALQQTPITVTQDGTIFVGVATGNVNVSYSPESWYVGKKFQVYNPAGTVMLNEFIIPADGVVPTFALPVDVLKSYIYYVKNADNTIFDQGTISVPSTAEVVMNMTQTKQVVSFNFGSDVFAIRQAFTVKRTSNLKAVYVADTTDASGAYQVSLPDGTYNVESASGLIFKTFTVSGAALNIDISTRYAANFCLGKTVAGAQIEIFLSSNKFLLTTLVVGADGKVSCPGLPNGRYYHNVKKFGATDTTIITKKYTFVIKDADFDLGNCGNLDQPYYLPYPVYYDISHQPEITWMTAKTFKPGELSRVKFDVYPLDTIYNIKDTTWIYTQGETKIDTTFKVNFDSTSIKSITTYDWGVSYNFNGIAQPASTPYVNGNQFNFRIAPNHKITFVTPILNPGLYNVYMSNRWGSTLVERPIIDTTYMDGKPLAVYDGLQRTFANYGNANVQRNFQATASNQAMHLGEALVTTNGTHELSLYSKIGSGPRGSYNQIWSNMIYFIPVDQDSAVITSVYYPKIDYCGYFVYATAAQGNIVNHTNLGTDGVNKVKYPSQFKDVSVYASSDVNYAKNFTVNGGVYSRGDKLTTVSPLDNWTVKSAVADTLTGSASVSLNVRENPYKWAMEVEGVNGTVDLSSADKTVTIPDVINTSITSLFTITPNADDPSLGTYFISSKIAITDALPFYYPITGVIVYTLDGNMLKAEGDTLYRVKNEALNGISPTYSTDMAISANYVMGSIYTGNGSRLQSATGSILQNSIKTNKLTAGIYPNPARESMNLRLNDNAGLASYAVYNQLGQVVRRGSFTGTQHQASLNGISKGLYLVKVKANGEELKTKLMVE